MKTTANVFILFVAAIHMYILWLEMFAWTTRGKKSFKGFPADLFEKTRGLAANQGLYNGFLAAGLVWSLFLGHPQYSAYVAVFFLSCVTTAGIFGALTIQRSIFFIQSLPALVAMVFIYFSLNPQAA